MKPIRNFEGSIVCLFVDWGTRFFYKKVKGRGGGTRSKFFFFVLLYVVALVILVPKWAHLPPNSKRLPRYGSTKMTRFHAFSAFCIGKWAKFGPKFNLIKCLIGLQVLYLT